MSRKEAKQHPGETQSRLVLLSNSEAQTAHGLRREWEGNLPHWGDFSLFSLFPFIPLPGLLKELLLL